jgi:type I restriction enzyme S subunit
MGEWRKRLLGDVIELKRGYDLPTAHRQEGTIPIVSSSGPSGFHNIAMVNGPGVVTGRYGTIGQVFYVESSFWPLNTALYVRDFKGNNVRFIYYFLKTLDWEQFNDKSGVPGVNRNHVHQEPVIVPEVQEQQAIASLLGALDDKIDLSRRMNETLESMAQTFFQSWFMDFDPIRAKAEGREPTCMDVRTAALFPDTLEDSALGKTPKGWYVGPLGGILELKRGYDLPQQRRIFGSIPIYSSSGLPGYHQ